MKILKISIALIIVSAIILFITRSLVRQDGIGEISLPKNQFSERIQREIDSLISLPESKFCKEYYNIVTFHINDYYIQGRLGTNVSENSQWKDNFYRTLFARYTEKFIHQVLYVFRDSTWKPVDLKFIRGEVLRLKAQKLNDEFLLERGSQTDKEFIQIQNTLKKYDEIVDFISISKSFSYSKAVIPDQFPISNVITILDRTKAYLNNRLENELLNNCTRLKNKLNEIPQSLFKAHVNYLDNKITKWSGKYTNYPSQKEYKTSLYDKLKAEVSSLYNGIYNVSNFNTEYNRLTNKLDDDSNAAYIHFSKN